MGMLSKTYKPFPDWSGYIKNKNEVVLFDSANIPLHTHYPKINLAYVDKLSNKDIIPGYENTSSYKGTLLYSKLDQDFFELSGKSHIEMRETRNYYDKRDIFTSNSITLPEITDFIKTWNETRGDLRYGWTLHSGYDVNFFTKYWESEKCDLLGMFFYDWDKLVGYSVMSLCPKDNVYYYIIRKNLTSYRNLALYIDYKMFEALYSKVQSDFLVCWGANSGGLLKYKKKFPVYHEQEKWFYKFKKIEAVNE